MAGTYPDVPDHRMAYHIDGTEGHDFDDVGAYRGQLSASELQTMNDESSGGYITDTSGSVVALKFPEPRTIAAAILFYAAAIGGYSLQGSNDTTNGWDGTWTTISFSTTFSYKQNPDDGYRDDIASVSANGGPWAWIRFLKSGSSNGSLKAFHVYGYADPDVDRIAFWETSSDVEITGAYFDWGDTPRDSTADKTFRVKNTSATATASGVVLSMETPTGDLDNRLLLSTDGSNFFSTIDLGDIAADTISGTLYLRYTNSTTDDLGVLPDGVAYIRVDIDGFV